MTHEFNPDWTLSSQDQLRVKLTLALARHVPDWPGCTDEQLDAVAAEMTTITDNSEKSPNAYTDHEAKAREIVRSGFDGHDVKMCNGESLVAAIASALREAEAGERERCAKIIDEHERASRENGFSDAAHIAQVHAAAIRSRNDE